MIQTRFSTVTFRSAFTLPGLDRYYPAGSYRVETDEEPLDANFPASRQIATTIMLRSGVSMRGWLVKPTDLEAALAKDVNEASP